MNNVRPKADVAIVGLGWCGSLIAEELTRAGLNVVAIERGPWFETATDFPPSVDTDELRWDTRRSMLLPPAIETTTMLQGGRGAVTVGNPTSGAMPAFAWKLSDQQIAATATYLRNSWGNAANGCALKFKGYKTVANNGDPTKPLNTHLKMYNLKLRVQI